jgi:DeoR/GlpR family transcriptional regulator of sugar metabolism
VLARQRQAAILSELRRTGGVRVSDLTDRLNVCDMTVRRDLDRLATAGHLAKVHGGAVALDTVVDEPGFAANRTVAWAAKRAIAAAAAELVEPGTAVGLSAGTTTWAMAEHLAAVEPLTVITNSTTIADTIATSTLDSGPTVLLTGGYRTPSAALVGPLADASLHMVSVDIAFIGAHGVSRQAGLSTPNLEEAQTNRILISRARRTVVLADAGKWGRVGLASFAELREIDLFICDRALSERDPDALAALSGLGVSVRLVDAEPSDGSDR